MAEKITKAGIILVDDHNVVIEGIKSALKKYPEFEIIGESNESLETVIKLVKSLKPDIMILGIHRPYLRGLEIVRKIRPVAPEIKIVIYAMHSAKDFLVDLFKTGISAYVLKDSPLSDLILSLRAVMNGGTYFNTIAFQILIDHIEAMDGKNSNENLYKSLSLREREVLKLLVKGTSIKENC